jgi:hypothetical protein
MIKQIGTWICQIALIACMFYGSIIIGLAVCHSIGNTYYQRGREDMKRQCFYQTQFHRERNRQLEIVNYNQKVKIRKLRGAL